jgi:hypothetical protein
MFRMPGKPCRLPLYARAVAVARDTGTVKSVKSVKLMVHPIVDGSSSAATIASATLPREVSVPAEVSGTGSSSPLGS